MLEDVEQCSKETVVRAVNGPQKAICPVGVLTELSQNNLGIKEVERGGAQFQTWINRPLNRWLLSSCET